MPGAGMRMKLGSFRISGRPDQEPGRISVPVFVMVRCGSRMPFLCVRNRVVRSDQSGRIFDKKCGRKSTKKFLKKVLDFYIYRCYSNEAVTKTAPNLDNRTV